MISFSFLYEEISSPLDELRQKIEKQNTNSGSSPYLLGALGGLAAAKLGYFAWKYNKNKKKKNEAVEEIK